MKKVIILIVFINIISILFANPFATKVKKNKNIIAKKSKTKPAKLIATSDIKPIKDGITAKAQTDSKLANLLVNQPNILISELVYEGSAELENNRIGVLVFRNEQFIVSDGDVIGDLKILDIKKDYILLLKNKRVKRINVR